MCGDSRDDRKGVLPRILSAVGRSDMEFLIHTGDLERPGGIRSWRTFREKAARFPKPLHVVIGNHELRGGTREEFVRFFALQGSSYSFNHRDAHFALADNAGGTLSPELLRWLDEDLARHPKGKNGIAFLVVAMHYPPRTDGIFPHGTARNYEEQSASLLQVLRRHRVDLLLASHEHLQQVEEWGGIKVVVSGGPGRRCTRSSGTASTGSAWKRAPRGRRSCGSGPPEMVLDMPSPEKVKHCISMETRGRGKAVRHVLKRLPRTVTEAG